MPGHDQRLLRIYLTERLLVASGGQNLGARMRRTTVIPNMQTTLLAAIVEFELARSTFTSFRRQLGAGTPRARLALATLAERAGRLKPNGRLRRRSPLADLEELDALASLLRLTAGTWSALAHAGIGQPSCLYQRAYACEAISASLAPARLASAHRALSPAARDAAAPIEAPWTFAIRVGSALRWGTGLMIALWRYVTREVYVRRTQETISGDDPKPADRPVPGDQEPLQPRSDGAGPTIRRRYRVRIENPRLDATQLISLLCRDPNVASPTEVARFVKVAGLLGEMVQGDEYVVWMPGPWNGPVRVAERTPRSFRLATMTGHMEAGEIEFSVQDCDAHLIFEIESSARSGSTPFWMLYGPLRVAKEAQLHMWTSFCERVAALAGDPATQVDVHTSQFAGDDGARRNGQSRRASRALAALPNRAVSFEPESVESVAPSEGWVIDEECTKLGTEVPGPPTPDGPFAVARALLRNYEFADPELIRAFYDPAEPLEHRNMLLEGTFLKLRFLFGVRVSESRDDVGQRAGLEFHRTGWSYRTLQGHLEVGQMDFDVLKWVDSGAVEFRVHAVSRRADIPNPVVRCGFRRFGRRLQLRFIRVAGERMAHLTQERVAGRSGRHDATPPSVQPVTAGHPRWPSPHPLRRTTPSR